METDKKTASRRLIHNAIRQTIYGEDPLVVHLASMACYDLLREYAKAKGIELSSNPFKNAPEAIRKDVVNVVKFVYHFLKHSKSDADRTFDEAEAIPFFDIVILMVIRMYVECFLDEETQHMRLFSAFVMVRNPDLVEPSIWDQAAASCASPGALRRLSVQRRIESLRNLREIFETVPVLLAEKEADLATLKAGQDFVPERRARASP